MAGSDAENGDGESLGPVLDRSHLEHATFGDKQLLVEVAGLFIEQLAASRSRLEAAKSEQDWHFLTHTLKGAAASVGATEISRLALSWEKSGLPKSAELRQAILLRFDGAAAAFRAEAARLPG